jgi:hypothetical protein
MGTEKIIEILERYVTNTQDEINWYDQMGLPLQLSYKYKSVPIPVEEISDVRRYRGSTIECVVYFNSGWNTICLANAEDLFIKINDLKNIRF